MKMTDHVKKRARQRGITVEAIRAALLWGFRTAVGGGKFCYFLGRREIACALRQGVNVGKFLGVVVIATTNPVVITTYRVPPWEY